MCQAFQQEGHEVSLVTLRADREPTDVWSYYGIEARFPLRRIKIPFPRRVLRFRNCYIALRALQHIKLRHVCLVYSRSLLESALASLLGLPTVFELHYLEFGSRLQEAYFRLLVKGWGFRRLVVITHALKEAIVEQYGGDIREDQVTVAPDAVDLERFAGFPCVTEARRRLGMEPISFVVGYAGHLYPGRGLELILALAGKISDVTFLIIGGMEEDIRKWNHRIADQQLTNIRLAGFVPNSELPDYLAACDVLLMPYQRKVETVGGRDTARWTSPMKMFEYMATGRLIISSNLPVLLEVLNETNAVLCDPEDVDGWQRAIERAMVDREWREQLGQQARKDVKQYTWRRRVQRVLSGL